MQVAVKMLAGAGTDPAIPQHVLEGFQKVCGWLLQLYTTGRAARRASRLPCPPPIGLALPLGFFQSAQPRRNA